MCQAAAIEAGWDTDVHGKVVILDNAPAQIISAVNMIKEARNENPLEPVIIAGYSHGGPAARNVAHLLAYGDNPVKVDLVFTVEYEDMGYVYPSLHDQPVKINNASKVVNVYAEDEELRLNLYFDAWYNPMNGENMVVSDDASVSNIPISESTTKSGGKAPVDHFSIIYNEIWPATPEGNNFNPDTFKILHEAIKETIPDFLHMPY